MEHPAQDGRRPAPHGDRGRRRGRAPILVPIVRDRLARPAAGRIPPRPGRIGIVLRRRRGGLLRVPRRGLPAGRPVRRLPARARHRAAARGRVGVVVLGERLAPGAWLGVGLLVAGLLVVQRPWRLLRSGTARDDRLGGRLRPPDRRDDRELLRAGPGRRPAGARRGSTPGSCGRCAASGCSRRLDPAAGRRRGVRGARRAARHAAGDRRRAADVQRPTRSCSSR